MGSNKMTDKEHRVEMQANILKKIKTIKSVSLRNKLLALNNIEIERNSVEEEKALKEFNELSLKYEHIYNEYHKEVAKVIKGETKPLITDGEKAFYEIEDDQDDIYDEDEKEEIPNYWKTIFLNAKFLPVNEKDEEILEHLKDVTLELSKDKLDFTVFFHFEKNDYFEPELLYRTYTYDPVSYEPVKSNSSTIQWKSKDLDPTVHFKSKKKVSEDDDGEVNESFFRYFIDEEGGDDHIFQHLRTHQSEFVRDDLVAFSMELFLDFFNKNDIIDLEKRTK